MASGGKMISSFAERRKIDWTALEARVDAMENLAITRSKIPREAHKDMWDIILDASHKLEQCFKQAPNVDLGRAINAIDTLQNAAMSADTALELPLISPRVKMVDPSDAAPETLK